MNKTEAKKLFKSVFTAVILAALISSAVFISGKLIFRQFYPQAYPEAVEKYSAQYNVPKELVYAVMNTESHFDENAVSDAGARGLMQITPQTFHWLQSKTGEELDDSSLFDPETNIKYGCFFLGMLINEFGDGREAVAAYNAGRGRVNEWLADTEYSADGKKLDKIPFSETAHYVKKVERARNIYSNLYLTEE